MTFCPDLQTQTGQINKILHHPLNFLSFNCHAKLQATQGNFKPRWLLALTAWNLNGHFKAMLVRHGFGGLVLLLVNSVIQPVADNLNTLTFNRITWKGIVKFSFKWMAPNQFSALMLYLTNPVIKKYFVWLFGCLDCWWPDRIFYVNRVITFWPSRSQNCSRQITGMYLTEELCMAERGTNPLAFVLQTARCGVRCQAYYNQRISCVFRLLLLATGKHGEAKDITCI